MKAMTGGDQVQSLYSSKQPPARGHGGRAMSRGRGSCDDSTDRGRDKSPMRRCKYCNRKHDGRKEACPAYGQVCRRCSRKNHFEAVCTSKSGGSKGARHVNEVVTDDEELLALGDADSDRWYTRLRIGGKMVRFLLDCGATVNLLPEAMVRSMGRLSEVRPAASTLRMFDKSELQTCGMITIAVEHPPTSRVYNLDFYVAAKHDKPLLGFTACRQLELLRVVEENICEVGTTELGNSTACITEAEIRAEYADLFEGVGLMEGDVHLEIDSIVPPVQMLLRRLLIGIRDKVTAELQRIEENGIIALVS
jgi:hypothetical protein